MTVWWVTVCDGVDVHPQSLKCGGLCSGGRGTGAPCEMRGVFGVCWISEVAVRHGRLNDDVEDERTGYHSSCSNKRWLSAAS